MTNFCVNDTDISVIIQGAITPITKQCFQSVRHFLPKAKIILSTWQGSNLDNINPDIVVFNEDPGAVVHNYFYPTYNNCNRQLVSTKSGLQQVNRLYTLKLRSDIFLQNNAFLKYWDCFCARDNNFSFFQHKILLGSLYSREFSCETGIPTPFHPSDFWLFGLTEDIRDYFSRATLLSNDELGLWNVKYPQRIPYSNHHWRYAPEQYYCYMWLKKYLPHISFEDWTDWNTEKDIASQQCLYNNFIFLSYKQSGIHSNKHERALLKEDSINGLINQKKFLLRYKQFCDPNFVIPPDNSIPNGLSYRYEKIKRRIKKYVSKIKNNHAS